MIQIYEPENIEFSKNGDMVLFPTKCTVKATLNSQWILEMEHPLDTDGRWESIVDYAVIKVPSFNGEQLFRISNKTKTDTHISVTAEPIFMDARNDCFLKDVRPTGKNGQDALNIMCAQNPKYSGKSDITKACTSYYETQNLIEAINGDDANSFINRWGGEILFDNYTVIINNRVGGDYGVNILYGKNIIKDGISEEVDMDVITRIVPKSFNGYMLPGEAPWVDSPIISNYPVIHTKVIKYEDIKLRADANENDEENGVTIVDTMEELQAELVRRCNEEFTIKGVDKPKVNISVKILLLQNTEAYKEYEELEHVSLGDTVHLEHSRLGIVTDARVIELEYDCIREIISSVDIGEFTYNYFNDISSTLDRVDKIIRPDGSLMAEKVQGILDGIYTQLRLQSTVAKKVNGRAFEISDLDPESELYGCMIFGSQGLQIATERTADGRDWNWRTAITAKGVVADAIISGLLSDKTGRNYWNLDTGEFRMTMEAFTVDGKTVEDIAKGAADDAQKLAQAYADKQLSDFTYVVSGDIYNLQKQIDGQIETFYYDYEPTLNNLPASKWTTETERAKHEGDLFYWKTKGYAYRFFKEGGIWKWQLVQDTDVTKALANAAKAQDTADSKRRIFIAQPTTPYDVGDTWMDGRDILTCTVGRQTGACQSSDWRKLNTYTDDAKLNAFISGDYKNAIDALKTQADKKAETWRQADDPAAEWTPEEKAEHKGDLWYKTTDQKAYIYTGTAWELMKTTPPDEVFDKIDGKAQIFVAQPAPPYEIGDLWFDGVDILTCVVDKETGEFTASDWEKRNSYTDDTLAQEALNEAQKGRILAVSLSNDTFVVPADADGNNGNYTGCNTVISVFYGTTDVTKSASVTVSKSSGITSSWSSLTKQCTVTNMTTDSGYIEFLVKYNSLSVTKRFTISKNKNGTDSRIYMLEPSTLVMKRGESGNLNPQRVTFYSRYKDGKSPEKVSYPGRFEIGESVNGSVWTTKYTSSTDESSVVYAPSSTAVTIKCTLYEAGGTDVMIDSQTVVILEDISALTHDMVFDRLTNGGKIQGLYTEGGNIYINAAYIKSGMLTLGGSGNQYGSLRMLDASGNKIGGWDKDGIYVDGGAIYCKTSETGASLYGGRMHLTHGTTEVGTIGTNYHVGYESRKGLVFDLESTGAYMAWAARTTSTGSYIIKLLYSSKTFGDYKADRLYIGCDMDCNNYNFRKLKVADSFSIANDTTCNIYSNIDYHNWTAKNIKLNNIVAFDGYAPFDGTFPIVYKIVDNGNGSITWYTGNVRVRSGGITAVPG